MNKKKYTVRLQEEVTPGMPWFSSEYISGINELKDLLKERGAMTVDLVCHLKFNDDVCKKNIYIPVNELTEAELEWAAEKVGYESRSIAFTPRKTTEK